MEFTSFVGIDVSKLTIDVALLDADGQPQGINKFANNTAGFNQMITWLKSQSKLNESLFCLEHTGIYSLPVCAFLEEAKLAYSLQPGLQIKRSMGIQRGKNDQADAHIIGRYAYLNRKDIPLYKLPSRIILKLKQLISYRERLVKSKVALQTAAKELKAFSTSDIHQLVVDDSTKHITQINQSITTIDKKLRQLIAADSELNTDTNYSSPYGEVELRNDELDNKISSIYNILLKRFYVLSQHSFSESFYDNNSDSLIKFFAEAEAINIANSILDNN